MVLDATAREPIVLEVLGAWMKMVQGGQTFGGYVFEAQIDCKGFLEEFNDMDVAARLRVQNLEANTNSNMVAEGRFTSGTAYGPMVGTAEEARMPDVSERLMGTSTSTSTTSYAVVEDQLAYNNDNAIYLVLVHLGWKCGTLQEEGDIDGWLREGRGEK
ncbi:hypothetical protein BT69DRAFT_1292065 [Atractiella rhizophila]|nr:hypothetical protein BT69DRAFT_1292065 [Atractiella rhizophila]